MQILLDTNALLWWLEDPMQLSAPARNALETPANSVFCSSVSAVEIAIKLTTGKLTLQADWEAAAQNAQFAFLSFTHNHARRFGSLPMLHRDPFDRMLVAQALTERATLVTSDEKLAGYNVPIIAARQ